MKRPDNIDMIVVSGLLLGLVEVMPDSLLCESINKVGLWLLEQA